MKNIIHNKIKYIFSMLMILGVWFMVGTQDVLANMEQDEMINRLAPYSEWVNIENGEVELECPREDVSETEMFYYIKDVFDLLKGNPGADFCEVNIKFAYTVEANGSDENAFYAAMFEREQQLCYYITNWSDLNSLDLKVGRNIHENETVSYVVVVELVLNGTKKYSDAESYYNKLYEIVAYAQSKYTTDIEKVYYFCKWLEDNVVYDETLTTNSAYVAIMEHKALCGGYANALKDLCSLIGIETLVPTNDELMHAWSEVRIDGVWYTVDLCYVVKPINGVRIMEYLFLTPDKEVDYVDFINTIKTELNVSTPFLNSPDTVTISEDTYNFEQYIRNIDENTVINYSSSNTNIVTIDDKGTITPINQGTVVINVDIYKNDRHYVLSQSIKSTYKKENITSANDTNSSNQNSSHKVSISTTESKDKASINSETDTTKNNTKNTSVGSNANKKGIKNIKVKLNKVNNLKGRKVKITWKKVKNATGYQIRYATNKKITKGKKNIKVKANLTKKTIKKLKIKKVYYFKIRAYKKVDGKLVYSKWSEVKKIKITK